MGMILGLLIFVAVLARKGRIGPFLWDPGRRPALGYGAPAASATEDAERILGRRLADGDLTVDDYYERLSLIQAR